MVRITTLVIAALALLCCDSISVAQKPLKVYVLAGQSNMVGTGGISTFDHIGDDPSTVALLGRMRGSDGEPRVCERVWISSRNGKRNQVGGEGFGKLTAGYGVRRKDPAKPDDCIGPEYTFGLTMEKAYGGPILLIKTAWGGQSLCVDFRSPGSGSYALNTQQVERYTKRGTLEQVRAQRKQATGRNYRYMVEHIRMVLGDLRRVCPEYDPDVGYELSGFVWFQGWNDFSDTETYPASDGDRQYEQYGDLLAQFIRDVRKDLNAPGLPFVVGVIGVYGNYTPKTFKVVKDSVRRMKLFRKAMAAPAQMKEFGGSVVAVPTAPFREDSLGFLEQKQSKVKAIARKLAKKHADGPNANGEMTSKQRKAFVADYRAKLLSPEELALWNRATSIGGFVHYYGSAKFHAQAGEAFAEALLAMKQ